MTENLREIVLGIVALAVAAAVGWCARSVAWRRALRRKQRFFGLPENAECLVIVAGEGDGESGEDGAVARHDAFALLELAGVVQDCRARLDVRSQDTGRRGFGERTEFCVGGPAANRRTAAHLQSLLPGVGVSTDAASEPERTELVVGGERRPMAEGVAEHVLLARLTAGQGGDVRPVFLLCGQTPMADRAAARYLARHHARLARKYGTGSFCLLLKVVNSEAYGPAVTELVADVTKAATTPPPDEEARAAKERALIRAIDRKR